MEPNYNKILPSSTHQTNVIPKKQPEDPPPHLPKWKSTTSTAKPTNLLQLSGYGRSTTHNELKRLLNPDRNPNTIIHSSKNLTSYVFCDSISSAMKLKQFIDNASLGSILTIYLTLTPTKFNHDITLYKNTGRNKNSYRQIGKGTEIKNLLAQLEREQELSNPIQNNLPLHDSIDEARNSKKIAHFLAGNSLKNDCWNEVCEKLANDLPLLHQTTTGVDIKAIIDNISQPQSKTTTNHQPKMKVKIPRHPIRMGLNTSPAIHFHELRKIQLRELIKYRNQVRRLQHTRSRRRQRLNPNHIHHINNNTYTKPQPSQSSQHQEPSNDPRAALYAFQDPSPNPIPSNTLPPRINHRPIGHPCMNESTLYHQTHRTDPPQTQTPPVQNPVIPATPTKPNTLKLTPPKLLTPQQVLMPPKHNNRTPTTSNSTLSKLNHVTPKTRIDTPEGSLDLPHFPESGTNLISTKQVASEPLQPRPPTTNPQQTNPDPTITVSPTNSHNEPSNTPPPQTTFSPGTFLRNFASLLLRIFTWGWENHKHEPHDNTNR